MKTTNEEGRDAVAGHVERPVRRLVKWRTGSGQEIERAECSKETEKRVWHVAPNRLR